MRKFLSCAAEDFREPENSFLMRYLQELLSVKDVGQTVWAGVRRPMRCLVRHPQVPTPSRKRQQKESDKAGCKNQCQNFSSHAVIHPASFRGEAAGQRPSAGKNRE